ncbi:MAG: phage holin family protein [Actinomycetota bacterium]|nr:phage holin family protein [Actinomycetota bacterium]
MSTSYEQSPGSSDPSPANSDSRPSIGELLAEVSQDITTLLRQEVELAKAEIKQSATRAGKGAGMLGGAGLAGYMVLLFLSVAAWWGLGDAMGHGWSALVVAAVWLLIAAVLALVGRKQLKEVSGVSQTADTVKKIPNAVKGNEETS